MKSDSALQAQKVLEADAQFSPNGALLAFRDKKMFLTVSKEGVVKIRSVETKLGIQR